MTCTPAPSAARRTVVSAIRRLVRDLLDAIFAAYGRVTHAAPPPSFAGQPHSDMAALIARRAQRRCNRSAKAASIYERVHLTLARGAEWTR